MLKTGPAYITCYKLKCSKKSNNYNCAIVLSNKHWFLPFPFVQEFWSRGQFLPFPNSVKTSQYPAFITITYYDTYNSFLLSIPLFRCAILLLTRSAIVNPAIPATRTVSAFAGCSTLQYSACAFTNTIAVQDMCRTKG